MKNVSETIKVKVSAEQMKLLIGIDNEDYSQIIRLAEKELKEKGKKALDKDEAIYALKQYYALGGINSANMHAVSDQIDPYWHAHILHTPQYVKFCEEIMGYYMHHEPLDHANKEEVKIMTELYDYTLVILGELFGNDINSMFWPKEPGDARMVCKHNTAPHLRTLDSYRPEEEKFEYARRMYSHI